jgi:hypothetical protein
MTPADGVSRRHDWRLREMKNVRTALILASALALLATGCGKKKDDKTGEDDGKTGGAAAAASGEAVSVSECDDYFKAYQACASRLEGSVKTKMEQSYKQQQDKLKTSPTATPEEKSALGAQCKALSDALAKNPKCGGK